MSRTAFTVVPSSKGFVGVPRTEAPCRMRTRTSGIAGDSQIARSQEPLRQDRKKQARLIFNQTPSSVPYPVWCSNSDIKNRSGGDGRNPKSADSDARYCRNCRNIASANCAAPSLTMNRIDRKCVCRRYPVPCVWSYWLGVHCGRMLRLGSSPVVGDISVFYFFFLGRTFLFKQLHLD